MSNLRHLALRGLSIDAGLQLAGSAHDSRSCSCFRKLRCYQTLQMAASSSINSRSPPLCRVDDVEHTQAAAVTTQVPPYRSVQDHNNQTYCMPSLLWCCALHCVVCGAGDQLLVLLRLPALRSLSLVDGAVRDESLAHVGRCTKLTRLELQVSGHNGEPHTNCASGVRMPCIGSGAGLLSGPHQNSSCARQQAGMLQRRNSLLHVLSTVAHATAVLSPCCRAWLLVLQGCHRLREQCLSHLVSLHQLSTFRCSMPLSESGLGLLVTASSHTLHFLECDCIEVQHADPHAHPAPAAAGAGAPGGSAGGAHGSGALGYSGGSGGGFGQLGPQLLALHALRLRRVTSGSPHLWQLAPRLTSLVVWGEASNTGLIRWVGCAHC